MSKLGESVRKLARYEKLKERIRRAEEDVKQLKKASIPGKRGIAYKNERNGNVTNQSGTPGVTLPNNSGNLFGNNQDSEENGATEDGSVDGESLFTNKPDIGEEPGTIELKDCATGERIDVNIATNGMTGENIFKPPTKPDGTSFGETNSQPTVSIYYPGYVFSYTTNGSDSVYVPDLDSALEGAKAYASTLTVPPGQTVTFDRWGLSFPPVNTDDPGPPSPSDLRGRITRWLDESSSAVQVSHPNLSSCTGATGDKLTACNSVNDPEYQPSAPTQWPEGTTHQLSWDGKKGGFFSSKFDPDIPNKWKRPTDSYDKGFGQLDLCTLDDTPVTIEAVEDGFVYYERDAGGQPDTTTKPIMKFDKTGKYTGTISEDRYNTMYD